MQQDDRARDNRRFLLLFSTFVLLITSLPYLIGYAVQGKDWRFTGFVFGVADGNSYIAKMLTGSVGAWLFRTPYTTFPQKGILAFLPYLLLGKLAQPPGEHEQLVALFHLFRIAAGFLMIQATYDLLALFLREERWRRYALMLAVLGGGLGWLPVILGLARSESTLPLDFYSPETFGFLSLYGLPHLALSRALLLWGLARYLTPPEQKTRPARSGIRALLHILQASGVSPGTLWLLLGLVQPLYVPVAWAVVGGHLILLTAWQAWRKRKGLPSSWDSWRNYGLRFIVAVALSSPLVIYTANASALDPFFQAWTRQNLILSPPPVQYLLAYGLVLLVILACLPKLLRSLSSQGTASNLMLPFAWVALLPALVYAPYNLQRRLAEGAWVALAALGAAGLEAIFSQAIMTDRHSSTTAGGRWSAFAVRMNLALRDSLTQRLPAALLIFLLPSTFLLLLGGFGSVLQPSEPQFRPAAQVEAFEFLANQSNPQDVVLASFDTGNALPAWAPLRVIAGHGPESPGWQELAPRLEAFFSAATPDSQRQDLIREFRVRWVVQGSSGVLLEGGNPQHPPFLHLVFEKEGISVYAVDR